MTLRRVAALSAVLAVIVPGLVEVIFHIIPFDLDRQIVLEKVALILWPSSIVLIGFDNARGFVAVEGLAISIGINVLLYVAIGSTVWFSVAMLRRRIG